MDYQNILDSMPDEFSEDMLVSELSNYGFERSNLTEIKKQASLQFMNMGTYPSVWNKSQPPKIVPKRKTLSSNHQKWD